MRLRQKLFNNTSFLHSRHKLSWLKVRLHAGHALQRDEWVWDIKFRRKNLHEWHWLSECQTRWVIMLNSESILSCGIVMKLAIALHFRDVVQNYCFAFSNGAI